MKPASGLTTALDPVMRACGGTWVAHGSGDADREVADERGRVAVPPEQPGLHLRRVWLTREEEQGYYYGFANEALWPLCHAAYTRPRFDAADWEQYRRVNQKFADAVLDEAADGPAVVFVQDYHFALLPRMLKDGPARTCDRPAVLAHSLAEPRGLPHLPVAGRDPRRPAGQRPAVLPHPVPLQQLPRNGGPRSIEAQVDMERFAVDPRRQDHASSGPTRSASTRTWWPRSPPADVQKERGTPAQAAPRPRTGCCSWAWIASITPRASRNASAPWTVCSRCIPNCKGTFCLVQVAAPSRTHIPTYRRLNEELDALVEEINWRHGDDSWQPIVYLNQHYDARADLRRSTASPPAAWSARCTTG